MSLLFGRAWLFVLCIFPTYFLYGQTYKISGRILDSISGEVLPFASLTSRDNTSAQVNNYGYYVIYLAKGSQQLKYSFVGYRTKVLDVIVSKNIQIDVELEPVSHQLDEVQVSAADLTTGQLVPGRNTITVAQVKDMPGLGGEADIFQSLQYLPGIRTAVEGTTGLSVRGGSFDQTLVQLDEAPVYNASHALGFFSTFNPDAIKSIDVYKGIIPVQHGGRLSSVVDLKMREGNNKDFNVAGGIGLISGRLIAEGPIKKNQASFIVSGRYSYAGTTANMLGNAAKTIKLSGFKNFQAGNDIRFYDLNLKLNWKSKNSKDHFFLSTYAGKDWFKYYLLQRGTYTQWKNQTASLRWNHIYGQRLFSNTTIYLSRYSYNYQLLNDRRDFSWEAGLKENGLKNEWDYFASGDTNIKFGLSLTSTHYNPGSITPNSHTSLTIPFTLDAKRTSQGGAFVGITSSITPKLSTYIGLRYSAFALTGPGIAYNYNGVTGELTDSTAYNSNKVMDFRSGLEPRISVTYSIMNKEVFSLVYNRSIQYLHLLSNSSVSLPTDVWFPSNANVGPQSSSLFSAGYKKVFPHFMATLETYYKEMTRVIDFIDNADLFVNQYIETQIKSGKGHSMGAEMLFEKNTGKLTGWISYTLSKTDRKIQGINHNNPYPTRFDRRHSFSLVSAYKLKKHISYSVDFQYNSGGAVSLPVAIYEYQGSTFNYYQNRNGYRLPSFHRLDMQVSFSKKKKWGERQWVVGLYNAYNKRNLFSVEVAPADYNYFQFSSISAVSLYGVVPSVAYNFKF